MFRFTRTGFIFFSYFPALDLSELCTEMRRICWYGNLPTVGKAAYGGRGNDEGVIRCALKEG